jgi:putative component of membrane protein insertase Oxa1/YidC/SpoIIIJ protein YidD
MRHFLLYIIKLYWFFIPADKRRTCIYHKSCSRHVYDITSEKGLFFGLKALTIRIKTCRPNHEIIYLDKENTLLIKLSDGTTLQENEIASNIVSLYKNKSMT